MFRLTVKHLRYFEALARHRHFGRAAEACSISQPALSVQMKELEELLGAPLIERNARQILLTGLGEALADRAHNVLRSIDEIEDLTQAHRAPLSGRLRIGAIPTVAPYLLPTLIKDLAARHPELGIRPREAVTQTLLAELLEGRLDLAIVALPVSEPALHEEPLFEEEFILVRSEADGKEPAPEREALREMPLLLLEEGHCFRDQALSFCKAGSSLPHDMLEASSLSTLVQMVGVGIGVTLIPEMAVEIETRSAPVGVVRLPHPRPSRKIGMVWRKTTPLAEQFQTVAERVRALRDVGRAAAEA